MVAKVAKVAKLRTGPVACGSPCLPASGVSRIANAFVRAGLALGTLALLAGCRVDTQIVTEVAADGSVVRRIVYELKDMERAKEAETYPAKVYLVPKGEPWKVEEDTQTRFAAQARVKAGDPIPGGYDRHIKAVDRHARNTVKLTVRDHYLGRSLTYEETYADALDPKEFVPTLLAEYDRFADGLLAGAAKEFGETHRLDPAEAYLRQELRKLVDETSQRVLKSGMIPALGSATWSLYMGGFPLRNFDALAKADPRDVLGMLVQHCLRKIQLKPEKELTVDKEAYEKQLKALMGGNVDEQSAAHRAMLAMGPAIERRVAEAARKARKEDAKSGVTVRLTALETALKEADGKRMDALVQRLAKEVEERYLKPAEAEKAKTEATLAKLLGGHLEANFAPCGFSFLNRLKMPGDLLEVDRPGIKLADGYVRWNFDALSFYHAPLVCRARSVVWDDQKVAALSLALTGGADTITLRMRSDIEAVVSVLGDEDCAKVSAAFAKSAEAKSRSPIDALSADESASKEIKECLASIAKVLDSSK